MVTTIAVVGDIIPPRERGRYQGFFGAVFGVSTVIGPLLGGFFVDNLSWRWIFYVNLPIGAAAFVVIGAVFRARSTQGRPSIDYLGAAVLAGALHVDRALHEPGRDDVRLGLAGDRRDDGRSGVVLLVLFPFVEARAAEPILPLELFRNPTFALTSAIGFIVGLALFGSITYLPLYLQIVKGNSPTQSGLQLTPLMAGLLVTSILSGNVDLAHRPLQAVPDRRHGDHDRRRLPALAARGGHADVGRRRLHGAARAGPRDGDAGARPRRPERGRLPLPRRRDLRLDALPAGRRLDRGRRRSGRSSPTGSATSWPPACRPARTCRPSPTRR